MSMGKDITNLSEQKILVTGGSGFLGRYVVAELIRQGAKVDNIIIPRSADCDLRVRQNCETVTAGIDIVIHLAGNVGGIGKNQQLPGTLFFDNAVMGIEIMEAARKNNVKKFVCVSTICAYPKYTPPPFREDDLWTGYPEETNAPYGLAKKMLLVQAQAYRQQFGFNAIYLLPVNMYGPGDNFDPASSHVIPALIRKMLEAKESGQASIEIWGDGTPTREFLYVEDSARGIVLATREYDKSDPVNLGAGQEISIKNLVTLLSELLEWNGEIIWNASKPNGQPRRLLDVSRAEREFNFKAETSFRDGLAKTIAWYKEQRKK
ncbi:MAG: GDP-L-fucose synthase [bacterium]|nr:GDP-L-fucose synthase [bacterium]